MVNREFPQEIRLVSAGHHVHLDRRIRRRWACPVHVVDAGVVEVVRLLEAAPVGPAVRYRRFHVVDVLPKKGSMVPRSGEPSPDGFIVLWVRVRVKVRVRVRVFENHN